MSVNWAACGTCHTKTEGTELGGIEGAKLDFPRNNSGSCQRIKLECGIILIIPRAAQSGSGTLLSFVSFPEKRNVSILASG